MEIKSVVAQVLKQQPVQEVPFNTLFLSSWKQDINLSLWKVHSLHLELGHPYRQWSETWSRDVCINKTHFFYNLLPKAQTLFRFFIY